MYYTSIEQSKKLLELGLSPESADNSWILSPVTNQYIRTASRYDCDGDIPCWSVGALRNLIPVGLNFEDGTVLFRNHNRIDGTWVYCFINANDDVVKIQFTGSDLRAAYDMVVWLLENNYIKKD